MIRNPFRRTASQAIVERLYSEIVAAARRPAFFLPPLSVPDTPEGRFDVLALHAFPILRRLSALPPPAADLAQDVTNRVFTGFDAALREMGVGDLTVPKRMKKLAEDFGGRNAAYARALEDEDLLSAAVSRNVFGRDRAPAATALAAWLRATAAIFEHQTFADFESKSLPFPAPPGSEPS